MGGYILRRILLAIPTLLGAVTIIFLLMNVLPGDIAMVMLTEQTGVVDPVQYQILRQNLGLNLPLYQQYFNWLWGLLRFDLGNSLWSGQPVITEISVRLPYTGSLVFMSLFVSIITAIPVGVVSALKQDTWLDYTLRGVVVAGISLPNFWLAILIILFLIRVFRWFPPLEYATLWDNPVIAIQQLVLPAAIMGFRAAMGSARMMRSSMLEVLREDYVRTARSKGLTERIVIYVHALRNAVLPVVTVFGMEIAFLFGGSVIIETIFNIPGIGSLLINAIHRRDILLVQGIVATLIIVLLIVNLLVDVLYGVIDPRIRYGKRR